MQDYVEKELEKILLTLGIENEPEFPEFIENFE